jgi:predicted fused transcriptional regulator/phosphomethylpyrimidine kinase
MAYNAIFIGGDKTIILKKAIAIELYKNNMDQIQISKILKISQPMISNYCNKKQKIPLDIKPIAEKISKKILNNNPINFLFCITYNKKFDEGDYYIAEKNEIISDEKNKIIDNLLEAFLIIKDKEIKDLIPEVKINIAMSKNNAKDTNDIAAFLNGLIISDESISGYNSIKFGKSKHLSNLLIKLKDKIDVNAIMNIAYTKKIEKTNFIIGNLTKDFKLKEKKKQYDILLHKGDFGIEPCAYILGKNAIDVVNKLIKIKEEIG